MSFYQKAISYLFTICLFSAAATVFAIPPDFNADRRVNIKCPSTIDYDYDGQFEIDGLMSTVKRLYHELDKNLKASFHENTAGRPGTGYVFSSDPNQGNFFICHAKAHFPSAGLPSLSPQDDIDFQDVFFITRIDWDKQVIEIVRQRDKKKFTIEMPDFEKAFLWYNALLDKNRAYIPIYGFLSLPGEADEFPTIWNSWEGHKKDTATPPESLIDYDFYKILDYRDGYYLLGKDFNELDYRDNIEDFGIIGWVKKEYITLWRSRLYYHPVQRARFFDNKIERRISAESDEINSFYVDHVYLKERLFNDIVEKLDQESLHAFYTHFGFPQLTHPEYLKDGVVSKVFIPGAFTPRIMRLLARSIKRNLNTFFLLDVSESMRPFADYVKSFNQSVQAMREEGIGLRMNRIYAFWDSPQSDNDKKAKPNYNRVRRPEGLQFAHKTGDRNYAEPLMRALVKTLAEIELLQNQRQILPLHEKWLFVITDAGPNDLDDDIFKYTVAKARELNLRVYFVYPSRHGVQNPSPNLQDTPSGSYRDLENLIAAYEAVNPGENQVLFRKFQFKIETLYSKKDRQKDFAEQHKQLLVGFKTYIDHIFKTEKSGELPKDVILYFSDEKLLEKMRKWSDRRIQVLNHVSKYITDIDNSSLWEERIAIPAKPVESYLRQIRTQDDISLADLKKLVIMNSLISVDDIEKCRKLYDHIKPLIEKKTSKSADAVFYKALTSKESGDNTQWNKSLAEKEGSLEEYISKRGFHLNSFNQAVQRKFMYLKVGELYAGAQ